MGRSLVLLLLRAARSVNGLEWTGRCRALYRRLPGERRLERSETFEGGVSISLRWFVAGAIRTVARGEKFEEYVRLLQRDQLGLARGTDQLLARDRRIADQCLQ
jgi:hypothetical protein